MQDLRSGSANRFRGQDARQDNMLTDAWLRDHQGNGVATCCRSGSACLGPDTGADSRPALAQQLDLWQRLQGSVTANAEAALPSALPLHIVACRPLPASLESASCCRALAVLAAKKISAMLLAA